MGGKAGRKKALFWKSRNTTLEKENSIPLYFPSLTKKQTVSHFYGGFILTARERISTKNPEKTIGLHIVEWNKYLISYKKLWLQRLAVSMWHTNYNQLIYFSYSWLQLVYGYKIHLPTESVSKQDCRAVRGWNGLEDHQQEALWKYDHRWYNGRHTK